ncbi:UNVERIFIED_CONTAM: hypothetical protein K2H54_072327 [Gekko kuhli]
MDNSEWQVLERLTEQPFLGLLRHRQCTNLLFLVAVLGDRSIGGHGNGGQEPHQGHLHLWRRKVEEARRLTGHCTGSSNGGRELLGATAVVTGGKAAVVLVVETVSFAEPSGEGGISGSYCGPSDSSSDGGEKLQQPDARGRELCQAQ